jgi:hypothetical protein
MENKRVTKKEYFEILRGIVEGNDELVAFIDHEVELLSKKSNVRTKAQIENDAIVEDIYNYLAGIGRPVTVTELIAEAQLEFTNQKVSALLKKLVDAGRVVKVTDKKKSYFSVVAD